MKTWHAVSCSRRWRAVVAAGIAGAVVAAALAGTATAAPDRPGTAAILQRGLDDLHHHGVTGTQGLVRDGSRVSWARSGVADLSTGAPMPVDGYFRMGSDTKTFVSVVVLQLVGEGRLGLDDPIDRWLPGVVAGNGNDGRRITVRQVLRHTSGIANYTDDLSALGSAEGYLAHRFDHYTEADLVALAMRHPPLFAPGTQWSYSNTNYVLAGMLVARVTGHSWADEVRARVLVPLRLEHTLYPGDRPTSPDPHAEGYQQFAPGGALVDTSVFNATVADAAGGMVSTTTDLARFWQAVQSGRLLRPAQMAEMHDTVLAVPFQALRPGVAYGLGIMWIPNRCGGYWAHFGDVPGTSTLDAVTPDGRRSVVLYEATKLADPGPAQAVELRGLQLLDDLVCA